MNESVEQYVRTVLHNIQAPPQERVRIETDLRAHLEEALQAGEPAQKVIERMGTPSEVAEAFMAGIRLRYAGFWRRLAAFIIDVAISLVLTLPLWAVTALIAPTLNAGASKVGNVVFVLFLGVMIGVMLMAIGVLLLYFPILEGRFGQTVGKKLLKLRPVCLFH